MPARKVYKSNGNSKDRTPPKYRYEDELDTQPTNSIDSELEEILAEYFTWKGEAIHEVSRTANYKRMVQAIHAKYVSRKEVEEAIGEDEKHQDSSFGGALPAFETEPMKHRNQFRAELRAKLLPPTKGGNDE